MIAILARQSRRRTVSHSGTAARQLSSAGLILRWSSDVLFI